MYQETLSKDFPKPTRVCYNRLTGKVTYKRETTMPTGTNNITELYFDTLHPLAENAQYLVLVLIMMGQALCTVNLWLGQVVYLAANIIGVWRCFALNRPLADKVKDFGCLGLTLALMCVMLVK